MGKLRRLSHEESPNRNPSAVMGYIGLAIALPPPSVHEVRLESDMFVTRLTFDFKIAHCEPKYDFFITSQKDVFVLIFDLSKIRIGCQNY